MEHFSDIVRELGGGLSAVVIVALAAWIWFREKRMNDLVDKFIQQNGDNIAAMHRLTSAIRERRQIDEN
jgi:hypothetical protein